MGKEEGRAEALSRDSSGALGRRVRVTESVLG